MTKFIYVKRDKKMNFFDHPVFTSLNDKDYTESCRRSISEVTDKKVLLRLNDCEVLSLGTFDDVSGVITPTQQVKLFDFSDFIPEEALQ